MCLRPYVINNHFWDCVSCRLALLVGLLCCLANFGPFSGDAEDDDNEDDDADDDDDDNDDDGVDFESHFRPFWVFLSFFLSSFLFFFLSRWIPDVILLRIGGIGSQIGPSRVSS